jgi:hypothetical protein
MQTGPPPWVANTSDLAARLDAIGLNATPMEGTALHIHQHLEILVNGASVQVPAEIGIANGGTSFSPIHTHTPDGIIHVESSAPRVFTLGQFFDVWGVPFTKTCLGPDCNSGSKTLAVFVNGHRVTGNPTLVELEEHQEIVVAYGTASQLPDPIPATYSFPGGL